MTGAPLRVALAIAPGADLARTLVERAAGDVPPANVLMVDPWDVTELVRRGGVDAGVLPKHVLDERSPRLFEVLDLGIGRETLVHAAGESKRDAGGRLRVATRYVRLATAHFAAASRQVVTLEMREAELAVTLGMADGAVLPVASGATRTPSGLAVLEPVMESSLRVIVGGAGRAVRGEELRRWLGELSAARDERTTPAAAPDEEVS